MLGGGWGHTEAAPQLRDCCLRMVGGSVGDACCYGAGRHLGVSTCCLMSSPICVSHRAQWVHLGGQAALASRATLGTEELGEQQEHGGSRVDR